MFRGLLCISMVAMLAASPASALPDPQQQTQAPAADASKAKKQNDVVCEVEEVTGSRLGAKRVCATRSQWQQRAQSDRQAIEKDQTQVGISNSGG